MADGFLVTSINMGTLFARSIARGVYGASSSSSRRPSRVARFCPSAGEKKEWWFAYGRAAHRRAPYGGAQRVFLRVLQCNEAISSQTSRRRPPPENT